MTNRSLQSRRNCFAKAGLDPQLYDKFMGVFCQEILAREPGAQKYVDDPALLSEVFDMMNEAWQETVYPPNEPALPQAEIPFDELYSLPGYLTALLECWHNWTIKSIANTISFIRRKPELQRECLVLADGFGAASFMMAAAFPSVPIKCHIMGASSLDLCNAICHQLQLPNLEIVAQPGTAPVVLAFECFEHFYEPQVFAEPVLAKCHMLVHSSPWRIAAHGHFKEYLIDGAPIPAAEVPRAFGQWLKKLGFVSSVKTYNFRFFNGDPEMYFKDIDQLQSTASTRPG
jgi:hypothetical protein